MAPIPQYIDNLTKIEYTLDEAVEYMKVRDFHPTNEFIRWKDAKTGKEVIIGYNY